MRGFDHEEIEKRAQEKWASLGLYQTDLKNAAKKPYYLLTEFPYPSGDLHIGHWYAFAVTDIFARLKRMRGANVLFPIGFDAFGLPAENAALKNKLDPKEWTYKNMERMREQLRSMGASFDWSREVVTCEPAYYKWTQWLFLKLMEHGLAYRAEAPVKWCPKDQTVLANEQVIDGACERCGTPVEEKRLTQWFLKITEYAERLLEDLEPLPWREEIKEAQRAWIGKSEGARITFLISGQNKKIEIFTTRPDTIYGATYVVLAPEHPFVSKINFSNEKEVEKYIAETRKKTERERSEQKEKTGVKLEGVSAINPATKEEIPIYLADYVLASYGTGAVMAVPAHDERDYEFAKKYDLPIKQVVEPLFVGRREDDTPKPNLPFVERPAITAIVKHWKDDAYLLLDWKGVAWTTFITGGVEEDQTPQDAACREIIEETGYRNLRLVKELTRYHSRFFHTPKQRNQFAHFSSLYFQLTDGSQDPVPPEEQAKHQYRWVPREEVEQALVPNGQKFLWNSLQREAAYVGSGILADSAEFSGRDSEEAKSDIVKAVGGEQATEFRIRDWLVSRQRYWGCPIPVVYDPEGKPHPVPPEHLPWLLPTDADFRPNEKGSPLASSKELKERVEKLFGKGWLPEYDTLDTFVDSSWYFMRYLAPKNEHDFSDKRLMKKWLPVDRYSGGSEHTTMHLLYARFFYKALYDLALVPGDEPFLERYNRGIILGPDGEKMSKSKGNVINPDEFVKKYGADAVRVYLAFIGPYNEAGNYPWNLDGVAAMRKFLDRIVRLALRAEAGPHLTHLSSIAARAAAKVEADCERFKFNTAIAALMTLLNELEKVQKISQKVMREFVVLLAPFAPHLAEHLWNELGGKGSVHQQTWPKAGPAPLKGETVEVIAQVNGKKRGAIRLTTTASESEAVAAAKHIAAVVTALGGRKPKRVVYVPGRILNLVI